MVIMRNNSVAFWGKAQPIEGASVDAHSVLAHSLDVAAVAMLLVQRQKDILTPQTLGFLISLHDIGKFSRPFQAQVPAHWPTDMLGALSASNPPPPGPRHDALGLYMLRRPLADQLHSILPPRRGSVRGWTDSDRGHLWRALAGHHGRPPEQLDPPPGPKVLCGNCLAAAAGFIDAMGEVFHPPPLLRPTEVEDVVRLGWRLAGLVTLADWVGSRQSWFPYVPASDLHDPTRYLHEHALPHAKAALFAAGLTPADPSNFTGLRGLFPGISLPTPVQHWAEHAPLPDGPVLAVIEDLTGSGKTEAALTLAHRLLADERAGGIFFGLPTMATANAMFGRLGDCYRGLFQPTTNPSLALAHGHSDLDLRFKTAIAPGDEPPVMAHADPADIPAEAHCAAWLAQDRRRTLLAQVGVGTLDQALLSVLPVRHAALRQQGLSRKVLIIDEAHAFDPYMRRELVELLRFHAALGGSAIILSATLPRAVRQGLVDAFRDGLGVAAQKLARTDYPMATLVGAEFVEESPCAVRDGLARRVAVTRLDGSAAALDRIEVAARQGAAVAWVRNTVDDAIAAADALRARGVDPLLFHARFAMQDRLAIEQAVINRFGRDSIGANRPGVLIATQVIEQSLDLDFDVMVTDLAPADLLIQRAGRLWRHQRGKRVVPAPELLIVAPEPVDEPRANWLGGEFAGTAAVYRDPALLWRSARAVFARGAIVTPDDMRPLIEVAFDRDAPGAIPAGLAAAAGGAEGKDMASVAVASQNVLEWSKGYDRQAGLWEPETSTPTRLEERPQVTLRLGLLRDGVIHPYADDPDPRRAWALSEVSVARYRVAQCPPPAGLEDAVAKARAGWGRWERESDRVLLSVLAPENGGFIFRVLRPAGEIGWVRYSVGEGISWISRPNRDEP